MSLIKVKTRGTDNVSGRKNIIINGAMQISQRIGTTATAITGGNYGIDRWHTYYDGNSYTTQQVTDAPAGFYNSMKLTVTGTTTPNYSFFGQRIEGLNVNHIGLGTANCQSFTVSFYVKSSVAGVYSISMTNGAGDLAYPVQYTINSADTWERKSMTIPPITSGTWVRDNTNGLYLRINLGSPGSRTAAADGWRSGNFDGANGSTGAVTWATTSGATFHMTGCQIEVGDSASDFEHRSHGEELALCERYYQVLLKHGDGSGGTTSTLGATALMYNSTYMAVPLTFRTRMRASPTLISANSSNCFRMYRSGGNDSFDDFSTGTGRTPYSIELYNTSDMSGTQGDSGFIETLNSNASLAVQAEL